ncbi:hypothetical protein NX059_003785 [Plenodomus lindquistii]|nr:hypothetical protein NX059_003785 [Plenodomus lindquistii]
MSLHVFYDCAREVPQLLSQLPYVFARRTLKTQEERDAAAIHNSTASPLLQLPPEIRQIIFEYALGNRYIHVAPIFAYDSHDTPNQLSLPLVCTQIYAESQPILRSCTFFRFDHVSELRNWVTRRSRMRAEAIRNVVIKGSVKEFVELPAYFSPRSIEFYLPNARVMEY